MDKFLEVVSLQKVKYKKGVPTGEVYRNHCWVNVDEILYISPTTTNVNIPEHNISFTEDGSKINMSDGTTLTCVTHPKTLTWDIQNLLNK